MRQEVGDGQRALRQAHLLGHEAGAAAAGLALPHVPPAAPAQHVVGDVAAPTLIQRWPPLQRHRGAVHAGDQVDRSRGGTWKGSRGLGRVRGRRSALGLAEQGPGGNGVDGEVSDIWRPAG